MGKDLIVRRSQLSGVVTAPGSKSVTHRALVVASLARGRSYLENCLRSLDTESTIRGLRALGVKIELDQNGAIVHGTGSGFLQPQGPINLGNSGTTLRFMTTLCGLVPGPCVLEGDESLNSRPMSELLECLDTIGVKAISLKDNGRAPIKVQGKGRIRGGSTSITGMTSSQFISSLLLSSPYFQQGLDLQVVEGFKSGPYITLTSEVMNDFGVSVRREGEIFNVEPGNYTSRRYRVEGDYSSAAFLMASAAVTNSSIEIAGLDRYSSQADRSFLNHIGKMGLHVVWKGELLEVGGCPNQGIDLDLSDSPDLVPPAAIMGVLAPDTTTIRGAEHVRLKESNRLRVLAQELSKIGVPIEETADGLVLEGGNFPEGGEVDSHGDHRIAMSMAVIGMATDGLKVKDAGCIEVSYPRFVEDLIGLGADLRWAA